MISTNNPFFVSVTKPLGRCIIRALVTGNLTSTVRVLSYLDILPREMTYA